MSGSSLAVVEPKLDDAIAPAPTPAPAAPPPFYDDPNAAELEAARVAVAAEGQGQADAPTPPAPAPSADPAPAPAPVAGEPAPIPYARFRELAERVQRAETALAYAEGRIQVLTNGGAAPVAPQPDNPTPTEPPEYAEARAVEEEWNAAWSDYDTGATTAVELGQKQLGLLARVLRLHIDAGNRSMQAWMQQQLQSLPPQVGVVDQQVMEQHVVRLETEHPWSTVLNEREAKALLAMAQAEAAALGKTYPKGPVGTMALQERVAQLASKHMPEWHQGEEPPVVNPRRPGSAPAAANPPAAHPPQPPARQAPVGPTRQDVETAIARANALPPNTPSAHGSASGPVTLARIDTMSDAELEALPAADRRRLLGIQS